MFKRIVASVLWFLATNATWNFVAFLTGWTDAVGPIVGLAAAAFVLADPLHLFWPIRPKSARVERLAAAGVIHA